MRGMNMPRLEVSQGLRAMMSYRKMAQPQPRMLVLESDYWLDHACINAAKSLGWELARAPVMMQGAMPRDMIGGFLETLLEFKPDFVLSINCSGMDEQGLFARFFADLQLPYVTWFVDDPRTILMDRTVYASEYAMALTWDASYEEYLRGLQFGVVQTMPLAVDPALFNADPPDSWDIPPSFVGNSMADFAAREWAWLAERPALAGAIHEAFDAGRITRQCFADGIEALLGRAVAAALDPDERRHAEMYCFIEGTRRLRWELMTRLVPEGVIIRGDDAWRELGGACGPYVNYSQELPHYYRRCAINLNITSIQMPTTVNQRVFDCPAAGGFLITDAQPALLDLFAEDEVLIYRTPDECIDLLRFYRSRPEQRTEFIRKARRRILQEHTYAHRLQTIAGHIRECYGA